MSSRESISPSKYEDRYAATGILCVASIIEKTFPSVELECIESPRDSTPEGLLVRIPEGVTHIGISLYSWNLPFFKKVVKEIKQRSPQVVLFAGGPEVTYNLETCKQLKLFDVLIVGEGELSAVKIVDQWIRNEIPDPVVHTPIPDLSLLPSPWASRFWTLDNCEHWELTRGCLFNCSYCKYVKTENELNTPRIRKFSWERINEELDLFIQKGGIQLSIDDCVFNSDLKWTLNLLDLFIQKAPAVKFIFKVRIETLTEEFISRASKLKEVALILGLQSIHPKVLLSANRPPVTKEKVIEIENLCKKYKIKTRIDLIAGLPEDTLEGFFESLDFVISLEPASIQAGVLMLLTESSLYLKRNDLEILWQKDFPFWITQTKAMSREGVKIAQEVARILPLIYNIDGHRNFPLMDHIRALGIRPSDFLLKLIKAIKVIPNKDRVFAESEDTPSEAQGIMESLLEEEYQKAIGNYTF